MFDYYLVWQPIFLFIFVVSVLWILNTVFRLRNTESGEIILFKNIPDRRKNAFWLTILIFVVGTFFAAFDNGVRNSDKDMTRFDNNKEYVETERVQREGIDAESVRETFNNRLNEENEE